MPERDEARREGRRKAVSGYTLRLPQEESVVLSQAAASRLIRRGDGDAALLYIAVLRSRGAGDEASLGAALAGRRTGSAGPSPCWRGRDWCPCLLRRRARESPPPPRRRRRSRRSGGRSTPARTWPGPWRGRSLPPSPPPWRRSWARSSPPRPGGPPGLYDQVGLPADVIFLLVGFCAERTARQYGPGRRPHPSARSSGRATTGPGWAL